MEHRNSLSLAIAIALALGCSSATLSGTLAALEYSGQAPSRLAAASMI